MCNKRQGHINSEVTDRAALAPISRAASAPIRGNGSAGSAPAGSAGSAPAPVVAFTTEYVRQGDNDTEDQVRQRITEGRQRNSVRQRIIEDQARQGTSEGRQGNIDVTHKEKQKKNINLADHQKLMDTDAIDMVTKEIIRDNEELKITIDKMTIRDREDFNNDIINMLKEMMKEGNKRLDKIAEAQGRTPGQVNVDTYRAALAPTSRADQAPIKKEGTTEATTSDTALKRISALETDEKKSWANDLINEAPLGAVRILRNQCQRHVTLNRRDQNLWPCVARRITKDLETSEVLADEDVTHMTNGELHRTLDKPRKIRVEFYAHKNCDESSGSGEEEECAPRILLDPVDEQRSLMESLMSLGVDQDAAAKNMSERYSPPRVTLEARR